MTTIPILFDEDTEEISDGTLGVLTPSPGAVIKQVDAGTIKESLSALTQNLSEVFQDLKAVGGFKLSTVQLAVQIGAEGGVSLVASGKVNASGTITLTFSQ